MKKKVVPLTITVCMVLFVAIGLVVWLPLQSASDGAVAHEKFDYVTDDDGLTMKREDWEAVQKLIDSQHRRQGIAEVQVPEALDVAARENPDVCAWLVVPGTNVSLAVAWRANDDEYYFIHDSTGARSVVGSAYVAGANGNGFDGPVTVIYGHSFSDADIVFTQLSRFSDSAFFSSHDSFSVHLPDRVLRYHVVAAGQMSSSDVLAAHDFSDSGELQLYYDELLALGRGQVREGASLDAAGDRIVQLFTCTLPAKDDARFVVTGVLAGVEKL